jgi:integrase
LRSAVERPLDRDRGRRGGHSSITVTFDRYGHLMPGNEGEAASVLDGYLERASEQVRVAQA